MSLLLRLALSFLLAAAMATAAHAERRIALVIGNSAYSAVSPLANPKNDAELMAKTLKSVGFEVTKLVDADQRTMKQAMLDFGRKLRDGADVSLFYYSGHGVQAKGENYLIPVDAAIKDEGELDLQTINVNAFLQVMDNASSKVNIIILDACRNNPFASSLRSATRGLTMLNAPTGTYIAYSTGIDQVAEDGTTGNSPFTQALARAIVKPGVKLEDTFKEVRRIVEAATSKKQVPWDTSSITGDFYFAPEADKPAAPPAPSLVASAENKPLPPPSPDIAAEAKPAVLPPSTEITADHTAWLKIANSTDTADFDRFLQAFPSSRFAAAAKARELGLAAEPPKQMAGLPAAGAAASEASGIFLRLNHWPSQAIALDHFHAAQKQFPAFLGDKQPNIKQVTLDTGEAAYRVRIGPFPDAAQATELCTRLRAAGGFCLMPDKRTVAGAAATDEPAPVIHSRGKLQVPQSYVANLEAGTVGAGGGLWFEAATASQFFLVPQKGAQFAPGDLSKRDFEACSSETYSTNRISLHDLPPGSFICVKTGSGRIASVRIDGLSPGSTHILALNYVVWE
jgi:hypothetical protein